MAKKKKKEDIYKFLDKFKKKVSLAVMSIVNKEATEEVDRITEIIQNHLAKYNISIEDKAKAENVNYSISDAVESALIDIAHKWLILKPEGHIKPYRIAEKFGPMSERYFIKEYGDIETEKNVAKKKPRSKKATPKKGVAQKMRTMK